MGGKAKISKQRAVIQPQSLPSAIFPEHWMILFHVCNCMTGQVHIGKKKRQFVPSTVKSNWDQGHK